MLPLALLLVGCNAPARQGPSTAGQADAPAQAPATAFSQEPLSSTAAPTGEPPEAAAAPTSEPAPEVTPAPTSVQYASGSSQVVYQTGTYELKGYLCVPEGEAPFPAVVYNHGGMGEQIGGAPAETCGALARDGFVGFSPIRRPTTSLQGHLDDVFAGVDYVRELGYVDPDRLAIMGFSRGGWLTFMAGTERPNDFKAIVIMAASVKILEGSLSEADRISAPVLLLVSENDVVQQDHLTAMREVDRALLAAGKEVEFIVLPPYQNDGHMMFFEVGDYWSQVRRFLGEQLEE